jgi:hypothetical protein
LTFSCSPPSPPSKIESEEDPDDLTRPEPEIPEGNIAAKYSFKVIGTVNPPSPRTGFMLSFYGEGELVLIGGVSKTEEERNVALLNTKNNKWTEMEIPPDAPGRFFSSLSILSEGSVFAWGGARFVNLTKTRGSRLDDGFLLKGGEIVHVKASDISSPTPSPSPRSGHCMVSFEKDGGNFVFMFGGENHGTFLADAWIFNVEDRRWTRLDDLVETPARRESHQCFRSVDRGKIIIHGGVGETGPKSDVWIYDVDGKSFGLVRPDSNSDARLNPCVSMSEDGILLVYGGSSPSLRYDGYVFDTVRKNTVQVLLSSPGEWPGSCVTKNGEAGALGAIGQGEWILSSISKDDKGRLFRDLWEVKFVGDKVLFERLNHGLESNNVIGRVATSGAKSVILWGSGDPNIDTDNKSEGILVKKQR